MKGSPMVYIAALALAIIQLAVSSPTNSSSHVALEQVERAAGAYLPIRINCGGYNLDKFEGDKHFVRANSGTYGISQRSGVYGSSRYAEKGNLRYDVPVPGGKVKVELLFSELWIPNRRRGARVFDIKVIADRQTTMERKDVDIFGRVKNRTLRLSFKLRASRLISIVIVRRRGDPTLNALAITSIGGNQGGGGGSNGGRPRPTRTPTTPQPPSGGGRGGLVGRVNLNDKKQTIQGIGASAAWYTNWLMAHPNKNTLLNKLFKELKISVLRLRNEYGRENVESDMRLSTELFKKAKSMINPAPKVLISSWSPPTYIKSDGQLSAGGGTPTLARGSDGTYMYGDFSKYWMDSLAKYKSLGVNPTWISPQNEPNFKADWEGCLFTPTEQGGTAGYNKAWEMLRRDVNGRFGSGAPMMLGPETAGIGFENVQDYVKMIPGNEMDRKSAIAHHLYNGGDVMEPDSFIPDMLKLRSFARSRNQALLQTEFARLVGRDGYDPIRLAWIMHNSFVIEEVEMYLHWDLFWGSNEATLCKLDNPWSRSSWSNSNGYTIFKSFYAFKHFSAYVKAGWRRVEASVNSDDLRISAYSGGNKAAVIIINLGVAEKQIALSGVRGTGTIYQTDLANKDCARVGTTRAGQTFRLPGPSITTVEF